MHFSMHSAGPSLPGQSAHHPARAGSVTFTHMARALVSVLRGITSCTTRSRGPLLPTVPAASSPGGGMTGSQEGRSELQLVTDKIESLEDKIAELEWLPAGHPERQRLTALDQLLTELQKEENILLAAAPGEAARRAPAVPVQRLQVVQDQDDPNVLRLRDATSHEPVKGRFVINPMVQYRMQDMRATEGLADFATRAQQKFKRGQRQTLLVVSGPIKSGKSYTAEKLLPAVVHSTFEFDYSSAGDSSVSSLTSHPIMATATPNANAPTTFPTTATTSSVASTSSSPTPGAIPESIPAPPSSTSGPTIAATTAASTTTTSATSSIASTVLPATARKPPPSIFLYVNCLGISRRQGTAGFFRGLLRTLKYAAIKQGLAAAATPPADDGTSNEDTLAALMDFYDLLPRDRITYVTLDEAQSFFLLEWPGSQAGVEQPQWWHQEIEQMRRSFKELVTTAPCHVVTVITGSMMAAVWANLAQTEPHGVALIVENTTLYLPSYPDADLMRSTWQQLQQVYKQLPAALRAQSLPGYALLIWLVKEWVVSGKGPVSNTHVLCEYRAKLCPAILADLKVVEETMAAVDPEAAAAFSNNLLNLLDCNVGGERYTLLRFGMLRFLGDELPWVATKQRHVWLESTLYRDMLQMVLSKDGKLQLVGSFLHEPTIGSWATLMTLRCLGEECSSARWSLDKPHNQALQNLLQELASSMKLSACQIYNSQWYQHMLAQCACSHSMSQGSGKSQYEHVAERWATGMGEVDLLLEYCVCVQHVITHAGVDPPWWLLLPGGCVPELLQLVQQEKVDRCLAALHVRTSSTAVSQTESSSPCSGTAAA